MQIKVTRIEDGPAKVDVINPSTGETLSCTEVNVGQEVVVSLPNAHAPEDVQIGEVQAVEQGSEAATEEPGGEPGQGEPGGEPEGGEPGGGDGE